MSRIPLAAPDLTPIRHQPTRHLVVALHDHGWVLVSPPHAGRASLTHPDRPGDTVDVLVALCDPNRIRRVWVNGERRLIRRAIEFIEEG